MELIKYCYQCKTEKPYTDFGISNMVAIGRQSECRVCAKKRGQLSYVKDKQKHINATKEWISTHKEKFREDCKRRAKAPIYRLWNSLRKHKKPHPGCKMKQLKLYIESKFSPEMTWENYGKAWEIRHIKTKANFIEDLSLYYHYTNLAPILIKRD